MTLLEQRKLIRAIVQVDALMKESHGVSGLHLNGDLALWDELTDTWLDEFNEAYREARHIHVSQTGTDACSYCGIDIRDPIHLRGDED